MLIKQLSIFLENKKGRFTEVAKLLGEAGVNCLPLLWLKIRILVFFV